MASNRLAVFTGPGQVELRSETVREPGPGEALVRLEACALCTMEQRLWQGASSGYPIAPGHEAAGVVEAVHAEGVTGVAVGDHVAIAFLDRCMQCDPCRRGDTHLCTGKFKGREPGKFRQIGGLADFAVVPAWKLFVMPTELSFDEIAMCEPVACVVHSVNKAQLAFGDDVLVVGGGTMGYLHAALARLRGARVFLSDPDPAKRELAQQQGASAAFEPDSTASEIRERTNGIGVDAVFVTFGVQGTATQAAECVRPGGTIVYYGKFPDGVDSGFDPDRLHRSEVVLEGARAQTLSDWHEATRLIARRLFDVPAIISGRYPLTQLAEALEHATRPDSFRIIVHP